MALELRFGRQSQHIYLTATREGAPLAAELARGAGPGRVFRVEPLGRIEDDPNVTDKRFPGPMAAAAAAALAWRSGGTSSTRVVASPITPRHARTPRG